MWASQRAEDLSPGQQALRSHPDNVSLSRPSQRGHRWAPRCRPTPGVREGIGCPWSSMIQPLDCSQLKHVEDL